MSFFLCELVVRVLLRRFPLLTMSLFSSTSQTDASEDPFHLYLFVKHFYQNSECVTAAYAGVILIFLSLCAVARSFPVFSFIEGCL